MPFTRRSFLALYSAPWLAHSSPALYAAASSRRLPNISKVRCGVSWCDDRGTRRAVLVIQRAGRLLRMPSFEEITERKIL